MRESSPEEMVKTKTEWVCQRKKKKRAESRSCKYLRGGRGSAEWFSTEESNETKRGEFPRSRGSVSAKGRQSRSSRKSSEELLKEKIIKPESGEFRLRILSNMGEFYTEVKILKKQLKPNCSNQQLTLLIDYIPIQKVFGIKNKLIN